jgi:hypothetical protein
MQQLTGIDDQIDDPIDDQLLRFHRTDNLWKHRSFAIPRSRQSCIDCCLR